MAALKLWSRFIQNWKVKTFVTYSKLFQAELLSTTLYGTNTTTTKVHSRRYVFQSGWLSVLLRWIWTNAEKCVKLSKGGITTDLNRCKEPECKRDNLWGHWTSRISQPCFGKWYNSSKASRKVSLSPIEKDSHLYYAEVINLTKIAFWALCWNTAAGRSN